MPFNAFRNKKVKGVSVSSDAQTTSDIFVCRLLFLFVLFVFFALVFYYFLGAFTQQDEKNVREKPTSQKEGKKRTFFFFSKYLLTAECCNKPTKKRQRRIFVVVGRHNLFLICFPFSMIQRETHTHIQENISNLSFDDIYLTQKGGEK